MAELTSPIIPPVVDPADMDETQKAMLRAIAEVETRSAIGIRDTILGEAMTTGRWVQTSLLIVNGGAAVATLNASSVEAWARMAAGGAFVTGIGLALLTGFLSVVLMKDAPRKVYEAGGYWLTVQFDLLRSEEIERDFATWVAAFERRMRWTYLPGGLSITAFLVGTIILGLGTT